MKIHLIAYFTHFERSPDKILKENTLIRAMKLAPTFNCDLNHMDNMLEFLEDAMDIDYRNYPQ